MISISAPSAGCAPSGIRSSGAASATALAGDGGEQVAIAGDPDNPGHRQPRQHQAAKQVETPANSPVHEPHLRATSGRDRRLARHRAKRCWCRPGTLEDRRACSSGHPEAPCSRKQLAHEDLSHVVLRVVAQTAGKYPEVAGAQHQRHRQHGQGMERPPMPRQTSAKVVNRRGTWSTPSSRDAARGESWP